jgi:hypothetical protein
VVLVVNVLHHQKYGPFGVARRERHRETAARSQGPEPGTRDLLRTGAHVDEVDRILGVDGGSRVDCGLRPVSELPLRCGGEHGIDLECVNGPTRTDQLGEDGREVACASADMHDALPELGRARVQASRM